MFCTAVMTAYMALPYPWLYHRCPVARCTLNYRCTNCIGTNCIGTICIGTNCIGTNCIGNKLYREQTVSGTYCIGNKLYREQIVSGTNCIEYNLYRAQIVSEFATQIQDLVVYVERTWVGSVRQLNKRQKINPPPPLPNQVVEHVRVDSGGQGDHQQPC